MEPQTRLRCARCGTRLKKGGTHYMLSAQLVSSFDGHIIDSPGDFESKLERIMESAKDLGEKELEEQVYKEFKYHVCSACRDEIDKYLDTGER